MGTEGQNYLVCLFVGLRTPLVTVTLPMFSKMRNLRRGYFVTVKEVLFNTILLTSYGENVLTRRLRL